MSEAFRRFEILLPLQFNDGLPVPDELVGDTIIELRQRFGAVSAETQTIRGIWQPRATSIETTSRGSSWTYRIPLRRSHTFVI